MAIRPPQCNRFLYDSKYRFQPYLGRLLNALCQMMFQMFKRTLSTNVFHQHYYSVTLDTVKNGKYFVGNEANMSPGTDFRRNVSIFLLQVFHPWKEFCEQNFFGNTTIGQFCLFWLMNLFCQRTDLLSTSVVVIDNMWPLLTENRKTPFKQSLGTRKIAWFRRNDQTRCCPDAKTCVRSRWSHAGALPGLGWRKSWSSWTSRIETP